MLLKTFTFCAINCIVVVLFVMYFVFQNKKNNELNEGTYNCKLLL